MTHSLYTEYSLQKRLLAVLGIATFLFACLFGKLFWVQIVEGKKLQIRAISQWTRDLPLCGLRGSFFDCNGNVIASSYTTYNVFVRPNAVKNPEEVALALSNILGISHEKVIKKVSQKGISENLIKQQVPFEMAKQVFGLNMAGVYISETSTRQYLYASLLSNVLGYCTIDNVGQSGLEAYYNNYLTGINGCSMVESDIKGLELSNATTSFIAGIPGCDITLTIDIGLQQILENTLKSAQSEHQSKTAYGILMNAQNGEILAMASNPTFDLNNPPRDDIETLMKLSKNIMITDVYEPGSTFKIFTTAAALSNGVTSVDDTFYDPGFRIVDGQKIKCWKTKGHGHQNLTDALCNSCNSVFMDLGLRLGTERLYSSLQKYGIGSRTNIDFYGESAGIMMDKNSVKNVDLARISFGQAVAVTPLQMITSVCGVLSGTLYEPKFIKSIQANNKIKKFEPVSRTKTVLPDVSSTILSMMEQVVSKNDGLYSFVPGYRIGGKTGTAQKYEDGKVAEGKYVSSFVGVYPVEKPQYALLLCVDEPSTGVYYGSLVAAPYGKQFFSQMFNYLNIAPTNLEEDLKAMENVVTIPNLIGLSISDACAKLVSLDLQYEIDGENGVVLAQSISPGEKVQHRSIVLLRT